MPTPLLALLLLIATTASGCAEAPDSAAPPIEETTAAPAVSEPDAEAAFQGVSTEQCRDTVGPRVSEEQSAGAMDVVRDHTVSLTTDVYGASCLVVLNRNVTAAQLAPSEPFPYTYAYFITDATAERVTELSLDTPPPAAGVVAVGFDRLNDDGEPEILVVHDQGPALVWVSFEPGRWTQDTPAPDEAGVSGAEARSIAALKDYYRDWFSTPVSP